MKLRLILGFTRRASHAFHYPGSRNSLNCIPQSWSERADASIESGLIEPPLLFCIRQQLPRRCRAGDATFRVLQHGGCNRLETFCVTFRRKGTLLISRAVISDCPSSTNILMKAKQQN